jgi:hypothetical protein
MFVLAVAGLLANSAGSWAQTQPAATAPVEFSQIPQRQAVVTYENDQLTIKAKNAPLSEVLRAVCKQIGAELDAQTDAREPVLGILGPGPVKDVLVSLLSDAHLNYVIKRAADNPNVIVSINISPETSTSKRHVAQQEAANPQDESATTASGDEKPGMNQMMELLDVARKQIAEGGIVLEGQEQDGGDGDADSANRSQTMEAAAILELIQTQLNEMAAAGSMPAAQTQTQTQASAAPPDISRASASGSPQAPRRSHRHRRR